MVVELAHCFGQEFLALLERIKDATTEADLEECQREYERQRSARKRRHKHTGAEVRPDNTSMIVRGDVFCLWNRSKCYLEQGHPSG